MNQPFMFCVGPFFYRTHLEPIVAGSVLKTKWKKKGFVVITLRGSVKAVKKTRKQFCEKLNRKQSVPEKRHIGSIVLQFGLK